MDQKNGTKGNGYKTAFKATSLFGGVQLFTIFITLLKSKLIALWLGTAGYGLMSIFTSAIQLIYSFSNLGLASGAVREISQANSQESKAQLTNITIAVSRWIIVTGIIGAIITIIISPFLSRFFFSSNQFTISFILLSSVVLLMGINEGNNSILQGTRHLIHLAKSNIYGSIIGLIVAVPLFYFFREKGIVSSMIISFALSSFISYLYVRKIEFLPLKQSVSESIIIGLSTVKLGLIMAISGIAVYGVEFVVKSYISKQGGINDVGLYQAGWTLNVGYLGLVFSAMAKDYFPRISQNATNHNKLNEQINQQAEISILILYPMIVFMLIFLPFLIELIYSNEFLTIVPMTRWLLIGSLIKAGSWAISFVFLAKGDHKIFLISELGINSIALPAYLLGYRFWGLQGIGFAYMLIYSIYFFGVSIIALRKYNFIYSSDFWKLFVIILFFLMGCVIINTFLTGKILYTAGSVIFLISFLYSLFELNNRIDFTGYLDRLRKR